MKHPQAIKFASKTPVLWIVVHTAICMALLGRQEMHEQVYDEQNAVVISAICARGRQSSQNKMANDLQQPKNELLPTFQRNLKNFFC